MQALIVDANVIIAAFLKDSATRKILLGEKFKLHSPQIVEQEIFKYLPEFSKKLDLNTDELKKIITELFEKAKIKIPPLELYSEFIPKAREISPDPKDVPYFALAIALKAPLWTQDKALKKQSTVKVFSTAELLEK